MIGKLKRQQPWSLLQPTALLCVLGGVLAGTATAAIGQDRDIPVIRMNDARVIVTNPAAPDEPPIDPALSSPRSSQTSSQRSSPTGESVNNVGGLGQRHSGQVVVESSQPNVYSTERSAPSASSAPLQVAQNRPAGAAATIDAQNPLWELYNQVQQLAEEVRYLRGMVESAQNATQQLDRKQKQNYVDLDERVTILEQAAGVAIVPATPSSAATSSVANSQRSADSNASAVADTNRAEASDLEALGAGQSPTVDASGAASASAATTVASAVRPKPNPPAKKPVPTSVQSRLSEKQAYEKVYKRLQAREFSAAKSGFETFIADYPKGQFVGSALYWLGELSLRQKSPDENEALGFIERLIAEYPDHARIPDALYKQATLKYRRQEVEAAREIFERILLDHPDTTAARLADHQLKRIDGSL